MYPEKLQEPESGTPKFTSFVLHQVAPDPAEIAARYGADTPVLNWRDRLLCSGCGGRQVDMVVTGTERR